MSYGFLVAGFAATLNAGRVALAVQSSRPAPRTFAVAAAAAAAVVVVGALLADTILDALSISPESFRIATGLVLAAAGVRTMIWPAPSPAPLVLILLTPELTALALSFGADEPTGKVLLAAVPAFLLLVVARQLRGRGSSAVAAQFLAALQMVVAVGLAVAGIRDV